MIKIHYKNYIRIELGALSNGLTNEIKRRLTFGNPLHLQGMAQAATGRVVTEHLRCWWEKDGHLHMTRGYLQDLLELLEGAGVSYAVDDHRLDLPLISMPFKEALKSWKLEAMGSMDSHECGVISAPFGAGKIAVAMALASQWCQPTMVILKFRRQVERWVEAVNQHLDIDPNQVKIMGLGSREIGSITLAIDRTLYKLEHLPSVGCMIIPACTELNLKIFRQIAFNHNGRYLLGLANKPYRSDGLTKLMAAYLGPTRYEIQ